MGMAVGPSGGQSADINVTPLIDVLLVLLIIFMVITPLTPKGLEALVPQPPPPNAPKNLNPDRTVVVQLIDRGAGQAPALKINQEDTTWENLQGRLTDIFKARAEKVMFVKGDNNVPFADVANVIDIAHAAGVDKVGLITAKIEAGGYSIALEGPEQAQGWCLALLLRVSTVPLIEMILWRGRFHHNEEKLTNAGTDRGCAGLILGHRMRQAQGARPT